jgi:hypothetical protein
VVLDPVIEHTEALQPLIAIRALRSQDPELSVTGDPQNAYHSPNQSEDQMRRPSSLVLSRQGRYEQAEEMHRQALRPSETVQGKKYPSTLTSMNYLANVLRRC